MRYNFVIVDWFICDSSQTWFWFLRTGLLCSTNTEMKYGQVPRTLAPRYTLLCTHRVRVPAIGSASTATLSKHHVTFTLPRVTLSYRHTLPFLPDRSVRRTLTSGNTFLSAHRVGVIAGWYTRTSTFVPLLTSTAGLLRGTAGVDQDVHFGEEVCQAPPAVVGAAACTGVGGTLVLLARVNWTFRPLCTLIWKGCY